MSQLTVHSLPPVVKLFCLIIAILCNLNNYFAAAQTILDRLRPNSNISGVGEEQVKIFPGSKVKRFDRLTVPLNGAANILQAQPAYYYVRPHFDYFSNYRNLFVTGWPYYPPVRVSPQWQAGAKLTGEGINGMITFQQLPYNNEIKVTLNATGIPAGKHALHIHTYGDLTDGCKSTGGQFPNNFLGNVDVKEGGEVNIAFLSIYLTLFGYNGIIGRSVVIHEKPIDLNTALNADIFSSSLHALHDPHAYQNEENSVGASIACGVISIMSQTLLACGYSGPCTNLNLLKWAIRAGASSEFFNNLVSWLESQLNVVTTTQQVRDNIRRLFSMLRHSVLMKPSYGSDAAMNPQEFRLQTLKVLTRQLQLRKLPERTQCVDAESCQTKQGSVEYRHLTVTFNMSKNQRLVRF